MNVCVESSIEEKYRSAPPNMVWIPSESFPIGSDKHDHEEAPVHRASIDDFWIDRAPVTNRHSKQFVRVTGYVTFAKTAPGPKAYPGALLDMFFAGSLVFTPPIVPARNRTSLV